MTQREGLLPRFEAMAKSVSDSLPRKCRNIEPASKIGKLTGLKRRAYS